jgi:hypothetical protein
VVIHKTQMGIVMDHMQTSRIKSTIYIKFLIKPETF